VCLQRIEVPHAPFGDLGIAVGALSCIPPGGGEEGVPVLSISDLNPPFTCTGVQLKERRSPLCFSMYSLVYNYLDGPFPGQGVYSYWDPVQLKDLCVSKGGGVYSSLLPALQPCRVVRICMQPFPFVRLPLRPPLRRLNLLPKVGDSREVKAVHLVFSFFGVTFSLENVHSPGKCRRMPILSVRWHLSRLPSGRRAEAPTFRRP
jgi:hypothetical protein